MEVLYSPLSNLLSASSVFPLSSAASPRSPGKTTKQIPKLSHPIALRQPRIHRTAEERREGGPGGCNEGWLRVGRPGYRILGAGRTGQRGLKKNRLRRCEWNESQSRDVFYNVWRDWKVERIKAGAECIFLKEGREGGGRKRQSSPPPMISYWTWQIGCSVAMDARQSLSSSANRA